jgi:hypothetical protein
LANFGGIFELSVKEAVRLTMDLGEIGFGNVDWINLAQDRGRCEHGDEPSGSIKCGEFLD